MRLLLFALVSLVAARGVVHAQIGSTLPLDSVRALPDDTVKLRAYVTLALEVDRRAGVERKRAWLMESDALAERSGATAAAVDHRLTLSTAHYNVRDFEAALAVGQSARTLANALGDERRLARAETKCSNAHARLGDLDSAATLALDALRRYRALGLRDDEAYVLCELADLYGDLDDRTTALAYAREAYALSAGTRDVEIRYLIAKRLARDLHRLDVLDTAAMVADTALRYARLEGSNRRVASALGVRASILKSQRRYAEAEDVYAEMRRYRGGRLSRGQRANYATLLARMGRGREARDTLLAVLPAYERDAKNPRNLLSIYSKLSLVDLSGPAYDSARAYVSKYRQLQDSLRAAGTRDRVLELEERYAAAERRAQIALQESELRTQRRTLWLVGTLLLLALAAVAAVWRLARRLRAKSRENEFLVKEIHHRVKNNLQVLASLLSLQGRHLHAPADARAAAAITEARTRVEAMGLIHRQLYTDASSLSAVEMPQYLRDLGDTILDTFDGQGFDVDIAYDVADVTLETDRAIPLGLIVNELVTNSLKYAFAPGERGTITISLRPRDSGRLALTVCDDGRGSSGAGVSAGGTGFGGSLIGLFAEKLGGEVRVLAMAGPGYGTEVVMGG